VQVNRSCHFTSLIIATIRQVGIVPTQLFQQLDDFRRSLFICERELERKLSALFCNRTLSVLRYENEYDHQKRQSGKQQLEDGEGSRVHAGMGRYGRIPGYPPRNKYQGSVSEPRPADAISKPFYAELRSGKLLQLLGPDLRNISDGLV
jgi:hypothetical protein